MYFWSRRWTISRKEAEALLADGAQIMCLGPRILRAETAPLYALICNFL